MTRDCLSRRACLGGLAGLAGGTALPTASARPPTDRSADATFGVTTRNLYLGVDLSRLFAADSLASARRITGELIADIGRRPFEPRAAAIAAELDAARPAVVGLQEAALVRTQRPSDATTRFGPNASTVAVDFLEVLSGELAACDIPYEVAASTVTTDVELPADVDGETIDVRLTDRDALLVRTDVDTRETETGTYDATYAPPNAPAGLGLRRGYCQATVTVGGVETAVTTTHLESADEDTRRAQAAELLNALPTDRPVVLAGDFNSGPPDPGPAYDLLTESFTDAHAALRPDDEGFTCCQDATLRNERSALSRRVDAVLCRGGVEPTAVERLGADPEDRVTADVDGQSVDLWPSDHAGVNATFEVTATPTPAGTEHTDDTVTTTTTTERQTETTTRTAAAGPGFGCVAALAGVAGLAARALRRDRE